MFWTVCLNVSDCLWLNSVRSLYAISFLPINVRTYCCEGQVRERCDNKALQVHQRQSWQKHKTALSQRMQASGQIPTDDRWSAEIKYHLGSAHGKVAGKLWKTTDETRGDRALHRLCSVMQKVAWTAELHEALNKCKHPVCLIEVFSGRHCIFITKEKLKSSNCQWIFRKQRDVLLSCTIVYTRPLQWDVCVNSHTMYRYRAIIYII